MKIGFILITLEGGYFLQSFDIISAMFCVVTISLHEIFIDIITMSMEIQTGRDENSKQDTCMSIVSCNLTHFLLAHLMFIYFYLFLRFRLN